MLPSRLGGVRLLCGEGRDYDAGVLRGGGAHHLHHGDDAARQRASPGGGANAPVQAVAPVIATMEAMPPVMALGGRLKQQQLLRRRSDGHGCRGREILCC